MAGNRPKKIKGIAYFAHKKVGQCSLRNFIKTECEMGEKIELAWKQGPYMSYAKIQGVAITYWNSKWALMFQGPREGGGNN